MSVIENQVKAATYNNKTLSLKTSPPDVKSSVPAATTGTSDLLAAAHTPNPKPRP